MSSILLNVASVKGLLSPLFGVVNNSTVLPILEDVLIKKDGNSFSFTTTDLENVLTIRSTPLHSEGDESICVRAKVLRQFLYKSLSDTFSIGLSKGKDKVVFNNGDFKLSWAADRVDDFPKIPALDNVKEVTIAVKEIKDHFANALIFVSNDDLRPSMTGVCLTDWKGELFVVATDAHRLYFSPIMKTPAALKGIVSIIPKKGIRTFLQTFAKGNVEISINGVYIQFKQENKCLISRLIDARYPEWPNVLPDNELEFSMQRKNLLSFLRMAEPFVHGSTKRITLVVNNKGITVSGGDVDWDNEFNYKMPIYNCNKEFPPFRFAVNLKFLMEIASVSKDEYCKFSHSGLPTKAMIIDDKCLLMPLMTNDID